MPVQFEAEGFTVNFDQLVEGDIESDLPNDETDQVEESVVTEAEDVALEDAIEESSDPSIKEDSV